jgi:glyoxylase-like metal-dependent hydrolase (beta-lactamase superfamily II)
MSGETLTLHGDEARFARGFREVGPGTWAWLQPNGGLGESNAGLVAGEGEVLLVDTLWDLRLTRRMLDEARRLIDLSPGVLVNTHSDGDHVWGNQLLAGARIVSTTTAREMMALDTPAELRRLRRLGRLLRWVGPLGELGRELSPFDWRGVELTLPTETFDGELGLTIGGRAVRLIEVGPAHTAGDLVVWLADVGVCLAADVLFIDCTPITWAGPIAGWLAAIDTVTDLGAGTYVPGHGPPCGAEEVARLRAYLEWVQGEGVPRLERGEAPADTARALLLSDEFASAPWACWEDPARLLVTLATENYRRAGGEGHLRGVGRTRAILAMGRLRRELERRR